MKQAQRNIKIDQSVKVSSWGTNFNQDPTRQIFQKYAQGSPKGNVTIEFTEQIRGGAFEESQLNVQSGFRKLKNEQIEKLKDLRNEYEQIRKIATDYAAPRGSRTPSEHSTSRAVSQAPQPQRESGGREVKILELEKKQLEIMVENSMKKIEELLHNEMGYKKTIHQMRLAKETRSSAELDPEGLNKLLKKKEREHAERVKLLQLERESLLSSLAGARDRVKYLQGSLTASQQELRRLLDEKRNFEQQLRLERDRYMSLQIDLRRQRRQHQISEKDKVAQINRLLKLKDVRQNASERELKNAVASLQEEVKVKEERYRILLQKFETYQREQKEKQERERENQARVVSQLLSKSTLPDPQSRLLQETIAGILNRLADLEKKPLVEIDNIVNHEHEEHQEVVERLVEKINQLSKQFQESNQQVIDLEAENYTLNTNLEKLEREFKRLSQRETEYTEEIQRLKKLEKNFKKDKSVGRIVGPRDKSDSTTTLVAASSDQLRLLQTKISHLTKENQSISAEKAALQEQARQLRLSISRLEFQVEKGLKQKAFALSLQQRSYEKKLQGLNTTNNQLKLQVNQLTSSLQTSRKDVESAISLKSQQIQRLSQTLQTLRRERSNVGTIMKQNINSSIVQIRAQNTSKLSQLTTTIQNLTLQNQRLQQQHQQYSSILQENQRLVQMLKRTRYLSSECDRLWTAKELQYQRIDEVLRYIPK